MPYGGGGAQISGTAKMGEIIIGDAVSTEGLEVAIQEIKIENDASDEIVAYAKIIELSDETGGTEDVIIREYLLMGGTLGLYFSSKVYTSAPIGAEAPVYGCRVQADRSTWDPASIGSGGAYWVWFDGDSWEVINGQVD